MRSFRSCAAFVAVLAAACSTVEVGPAHDAGPPPADALATVRQHLRVSLKDVDAPQVTVLGAPKPLRIAGASGWGICYELSTRAAGTSRQLLLWRTGRVVASSDAADAPRGMADAGCGYMKAP